MTQQILLRAGVLGSADVALRPMTESSAAVLGSGLANIQPWTRYQVPPYALSAFLSDHEPGAPRYELRVGDALAGGMVLRLNWMRGPYLQFLGLLPDFQHQGIGDLVLRWLEDTAVKCEDRNLWVAASEFNARALSFYEGHGFMRVATIDDLVRDGINEILLRKKLAPLR